MHKKLLDVSIYQNYISIYLKIFHFCEMLTMFSMSGSDYAVILLQLPTYFPEKHFPSPSGGCFRHNTLSGPGWRNHAWRIDWRDDDHSGDAGSQWLAETQRSASVQLCCLEVCALYFLGSLAHIRTKYTTSRSVEELSRVIDCLSDNKSK